MEYLKKSEEIVDAKMSDLESTTKSKTLEEVADRMETGSIATSSLTLNLRVARKIKEQLDATYEALQEKYIAGNAQSNPTLKLEKSTKESVPLMGQDVQEREVRGDRIATNIPIELQYNRNPQSAPNMGSLFGQDVEPTGTYVTQKVSDFTPGGFETGTVRIQNPLVIDITDDTQIEYKRKLSEENEGKKGVELSNALKQKGFDAIVTKNEDGTTGEIVLLNDISTYRESVPLMGQDTQFQLNSSQKQRLEKASTKATNARKRINNSKKITEAQKKKEIDKINKEFKEKRSEIIDEFVDLQDKADKKLADVIEEVGEENLAQDPFETVPPPTEEAIKIEVKNPPKNLKRIKLKEIIGKKISLLMADRLKVELTDPSKPLILKQIHIKLWVDLSSLL